MCRGPAHAGVTSAKRCPRVVNSSDDKQRLCPLRSDFYDDELARDRFFVEVERYKRMKGKDFTAVIPLRVSYFFRMHHVDEDSIRINQRVNDARFIIELLNVALGHAQLPRS